MKTYESYKDSNIAWIGQIPSNWSICRVKHGFVRKKDKSFDKNPIVLSLARDGVKIRDISSNEGQLAESYEGYNPVIPHDLLLNPMDLYSGANCSISKVSGVISPAYINLRAKDNVSPIFFDYYFKVQYWTMAFFAHGKGISFDNRWTLGNETLNNYPIVMPTFKEQQEIALFLDIKCAQIDSLISLQEKMIEELIAYKQAVIMETVTKGLNSNSPMKDSGIEWIGKIPEGWQTIKLNRIMGFIGGYAFNSNKYAKEQTHNQVIRIGNVKNNYLKLDASPIFIDDNVAIEAAKCKLNENCILFTMTGTKGKRDYFYTLLLKKEHFKNKDLYLNQRVGCFVQKSQNIDMRYYNYLLKDNHILDSIFLYETGTANQGNLGIETINRTILQFPPLVEQCAIANYLDTQTSQIDELIALKHKKIDQLVEYKKSVIYEYVTGKKRV